jgi:hypothetical protein
VLEVDGQPKIVAFDSIERLELHRGKEGRAGQGAVIGALTGGVGVGLAILACDDPGSLVPSCADIAPYLVIGGAALGVLIGAAIGSNVGPDRWEVVPVDRVRLALGPGRSGDMVVGLSVSR